MLNFSCPDDWRRIARAVAILAAGLACLASARAATFTVTTTNHTGPGSLRQAILDANALPGPDVISFNIVSSGLGIIPTNALPAVTDPVSIDGTTQPGFAGSPIIELNGQSAGTAVDGLRLWAGNSTIRGLVINRFNGDGIEVATNGNNVIEGCIIGLNVAGAVDQGNNLSGIFITNAPNNRIGGSTSAQRNVISGNNQNGVLIQALGASGNVVLGNLIGLNATGGVAVANNANGIYFFGAPSNTVGGTPAGAGNVISGNSQSGVRLEGTNAFANVIAGNIIGLDSSGLIDLGNNQQGVAVVNAVTNLIGGTTPAARNIISGNNQTGVRLDSASARGNRISGNFIGTDASGQLARGNSFEGVNAQNNAAFNSIGGTSAGEANLIAFNGGDGVFLPNGTNNAVRANAIHSNAGLGIDLGSDGKQTNDAGDADTGANQLQNYPVLTAATNTPGGLVVFGSLNSRPNGVYALDFYSSSLCDPSTNGEGQVHLGSLVVTTGADSNTTFNVTLPAATGRFIAATATDTNGNTSEFSTCVRAESLLPPTTFAVLNTNDAGAGSLRQAILDNNLAVRNGRNTIIFAISGAGSLVLSPVSQLPSPTEPVAIDGYTQPGAGVNTLANGNNAVIRIRLDGAGAGNGADGLRLTSTGMVVRGLAITRFNGDGIEISTNGLNAVEGCFVGLDTDGTNAFGNGSHGVHINATANNQVGGAAPAQRNVISGNSQNGVHVTGGGATNNFIAGNFIGTDRSGAVDLGNNGDGINLNNAPFNLVGSVASGAGNLISGNNNDGIDINGASSTNNTVLGNTIGSDVAGSVALGNNQNGVVFNSNARFNRVGLNVGGGANVIAFNGNIGVAVNGGTNNPIQANRIFGNGVIGIDLGNNGVTANDAGDGDTGPNQLQNFPVITNGTINPANIVVAGTLNSRPSMAYVIDFFANLVCDASGNGEGQQHFGSASVTTDGTGNATFNITLPGVPVGRYLTATATDTNGNTSEFSACFAAASTLPPVTLTVVNTNDSGPGSLRQALLDAGNFASGSANLIAFNIPGVGPHTIAPLTQLPSALEPVFIDGYTQPGALPNTLSNGNNAVIKIRLDGSSNGSFAPDGLRLRAGGSTVRGLAFLRWTSSDAIEITQGDGNRVAGCFLGIDLDGSDKHNGQSIFISSARNEIGGLTPADRNVIAYSFGDGIRISGPLASNNIVRGNFLGTDFTGTLKRGNLIAGLTIAGATNNLVGGTEPGARNLISGNQTGLSISGDSGGNVVIGNSVGTDVAGTGDLGNLQGGIIVNGGSDNVIGGTSAAARNIISGNENVGVSLFNTASARVIGNWIGLSATGAALSNSSSGIYVNGNSNRIGGVVPGEGNVIAWNGDSGILVPGGIGNAIRGNAIYDNRVRIAFRQGLGIDLGEDGVTANEAGDGDAGPNNRQNFAVVTNAFSSGASTTIQGSLNSAAAQTYQLDFFANLACDASGHGEGQQYLGSTSVTTDGSGNIGFGVTLSVGALGRFITTTATDAQGNTSEFSPCYEAMLSTPPATFTVTTTNDAGPGSLRQGILDSNGHVSSQNNTIAFNIPGGGIRAIKLLSSLPAFIQPVTIDGFTQPGASANSLPGGNDANWLIELRGVGASFNEETLRLNIARLVVRGLRLTHSAGIAVEMVSSNCVVAGCFIFGNGAGGIEINTAHGNRIGGTVPADRNVIAGHNGSRAVEIGGGNNNLVLGNFLGPAPDGTSLPGSSQFDGVNIFNGSGNIIGDGTAGGANVIAFHSSDAVAIQSGTNNSVRGNRIFSNGFPIDLGSDSATPNDVGDADTGANHVQNFPILTNAVANVGSTLIQGRLNSRPNTGYTLDFHASTVCHFSGNGEGEFYLGSANVTTDAGGNANFNVTLPVTAPRAILTATATDPAGNTSEFSPCRAATVNLPGQTFTVVNTNDSGPGSLRQALIEVSLQSNTTPDQIAFNIPGPGVKVIRPLTPLPSPTHSVVIDGATQPGGGFAAAGGVTAPPIIQLDGLIIGSGPGLNLTGDGSTVQGLSVTRFPGSGLLLSGDNNTIRGNRIGVDPFGAIAGNGGGILIQGSGNFVGGLTLGAGNVISGNEDSGILLVGIGANNNVIQGNFIGTDASGAILLPNEDNGIRLFNAPNNTIGGIVPGAGNVICGNGEDGIRIEQLSSINNLVQGNFIGTNPDQDGDLCNERNAVLITGGAQDCTIGGFDPKAGNLIASCAQYGIRVDSGNGNAILGNSFVNGTGLHISVVPGANGNVQPPQLDVASRDEVGDITVSGRVNGTPNTTYMVQLYGLAHHRVTQTSTYVPISRFNVTTGSSGQSPFSETFSPTLHADKDPIPTIEGTTTRDNNTSQVSPGTHVVPAGTVDLRLTKTAQNVFSSVGDRTTFVLALSNGGPANATDVRLTDVLPTGFSDLMVNMPPQVNLTVSGQSLDFQIPEVPAGSELLITLDVLNGLAGVITNTATVSAAQTDNLPSNNTDIADVIISGPNQGLTTAANTPHAHSVGEPISTFSGELYELFPPDLVFHGGPRRFGFQRFYGSRLKADGHIAGTLGENWLHNFEAKLTDRGATVEVVLFPGLFLVFANNGGAYTQANRPDTRFQLRASGGNFILGDPRTQQLLTFNAAGQLILIEDGRGNAQVLTYSGGRLAGVNGVLVFSYSASGLLTNVSDGTRNVSFAQSGNRLISSRDALGQTTLYAYSGSFSNAALLTSFQEPAGNTPFNQTFNQFGQVASQAFAGRPATQLDYFGELTRIRDPQFFFSEDLHDANGNLLASRDANGQTVVMDYNAAGQRTAVLDRLGDQTDINFDPASGHPAGVTNADGTVTAFHYAARTVNGVTFHDLDEILLADGSIERLAYDANGNLVAREDAEGQLFRYGWNTRGQMLAATNPTGGSVHFTYHPNGTLAASRDSDTGLTLYLYDHLGRLTNITHPDGTTRRFSFDARDQLSSLTDERGNSLRFIHDANGRLTHVVDPQGNTNAYVYDAGDRLVLTVDRKNQRIGYAYDARDLLSFITNRLGNRTQFQYDPQGRLTGVIDSGNRFWRFEHDAEGLVTGMVNPLSQAIRFQLDHLGYIVGVTNPLGQTTKYVRDRMRRIKAIEDPLGRRRHYTYDHCGRLLSASDPDAGTAIYGRNQLGLLTTLTDPAGAKWDFTHTPAGRPLSVTDPRGRRTRFTHNNRGRRVAVEFPNGVTRSNAFDAAGNLVGTRFSDGTMMTYGFDSLNRITNADGVALAYDAEGRIVNSTSGGIQFGAMYDAAGRLTNASYNNNQFTVRYDYDVRDRLMRVRDSLTGTQMDFSYDDAGRLTGLTRPNGVNGTYNYDPAGQLIRIREGNVIDLQYTIDAAGQVIRTDYQVPLDPAGLLGGATSTWSFDLAHQINSPGYTYDALGRLIQAPGHIFTWDGASRLTGINDVQLTYNGLNEIVTRTEDGVTTLFYNHHALGLAPMAAERNNNTGLFTCFFVYTPGGRLLYMVNPQAGNSVQFFHFDRTGSTLALTGGNGAMTDAYAYTPYGQVLGHTGPSVQPFTFNGAFGVRDEPAADLFQMRNRYYDPVTGRFISTNPLWPDLTDVSSLNPYTFAANTPVTSLNPLGLNSVTPFTRRPDKIDGQFPTFTDPGTIADTIFEGSGAVVDRLAARAANTVKLNQAGDYTTVLRQLEGYEKVKEGIGTAGNVVGGVLDFAGEFSQARDEGKGVIQSGARGGLNAAAGYAIGVASAPVAFVDGMTGGNLQHNIMQVYRVPEALLGNSRDGAAYVKAVESGQYGVVAEVIHGIGDRAANAAPKLSEQGFGETFTALGWALGDAFGLLDNEVPSGPTGPPPPPPVSRNAASPQSIPPNLREAPNKP